MVGNPEDRFSPIEAYYVFDDHLKFIFLLCRTGVNDLQNTIVSLKEDLKVAKSDNDRLLHR